MKLNEKIITYFLNLKNKNLCRVIMREIQINKFVKYPIKIKSKVKLD